MLHLLGPLDLGLEPRKPRRGPPGPYGTWKVGTIWPMDLVFMSTFDNQTMSIGCIAKLGHLSGFLRHYLLTFLLF